MEGMCTRKASMCTHSELLVRILETYRCSWWLSDHIFFPLTLICKQFIFGDKWQLKRAYILGESWPLTQHLAACLKSAFLLEHFSLKPLLNQQRGYTLFSFTASSVPEWNKDIKAGAEVFNIFIYFNQHNHRQADREQRAPRVKESDWISYASKHKATQFNIMTWKQLQKMFSNKINILCTNYTEQNILRTFFLKIQMLPSEFILVQMQPGIPGVGDYQRKKIKMRQDIISNLITQIRKLRYTGF